MKNPPLLSLITINLNNRRGLEQTIRSVISQSFKDYEFIILDGESKDDSKQVIVEFASTLQYWASEPDTGIYDAMNKGIAKATGQYCLFLNSGDWLIDKDVLKRCFEAEPSADLLIGSCNITANGRLIHTTKPKADLTLQSFFGATIPHQSTFIKRDLFVKLGNYKDAYKIHGDYEFWIRSVIMHHCSIAVLETIVTSYNLEGISNDPAYSKQSQRELRQIRQHYFPKRILVDYADWIDQKGQLQVWEWVKSKKILYKGITLIYSSAVKLVAVKRRLMFFKKNK